MNHKTGLSQRLLALTFVCSQQYNDIVIKRLKISYRRRIKDVLQWGKHGRVADFLDSKSDSYAKKQDNPTEVPQYRPIEEVFELLLTRFYFLPQKLGRSGFSSPEAENPTVHWRDPRCNCTRDYFYHLRNDCCGPTIVDFWMFATDYFYYKLIILTLSLCVSLISPKISSWALKSVQFFKLSPVIVHNSDFFIAYILTRTILTHTVECLYNAYFYLLFILKQFTVWSFFFIICSFILTANNGRKIDGRTNLWV